MPSETAKTLLDHTAFPFIIDTILAYAYESPKACATLRRVCRSFRDRVDARPLPHIYVHMSTNKDGVSRPVISAPLGCADGPLPLGVPCDLNAVLSDTERAAHQARFAETRVVDLGPAAPRGGGAPSNEPVCQYVQDMTSHARLVRYFLHLDWENEPGLDRVEPRPFKFDIQGSEQATRIDFLWLRWGYNTTVPDAHMDILYECRERIINVLYDPRHQRTRFSSWMSYRGLVIEGREPRSIVVIFTPVLPPHAPPDYTQIRTTLGCRMQYVSAGGVFSTTAEEITRYINSDIDTTWTIVGIDEMNPLHINLFDGDDQDEIKLQQRIFHTKIDKTRDEMENHLRHIIERKLRPGRSLSCLTFLSRQEYADRVGPEMFALATDENAVVPGGCPL